jgi:hypothetical protein
LLVAHENFSIIKNKRQKSQLRPSGEPGAPPRRRHPEWNGHRNNRETFLPPGSVHAVDTIAARRGDCIDFDQIIESVRIPDENPPVYSAVQREKFFLIIRCSDMDYYKMILF